MNIAKTFSIGKFLDTEIEIQWLVVAMMAFFGLFSGMAAVVSWVFLYFSVILHEYGHILTARNFGIPCYKVIITPIGGVALLNLQEDAAHYRPKQHLAIALGGPVVSLTLAVVFGLAAHFTESKILFQAGLMNLVLFVFNMIPAFPMDGGRVFKSLLFLIGRMKNYRKASRITGIVGMVFAALIAIFFISTGNFVPALIGGFIGIQAYSEYKNNK